MSINEELPSNSELNEQFVEIQEIIYDIDSTNLEETENELESINNQMNQSLFNSRSSMTFLLKALKSAMMSRPFYNDNHFLLIQYLSDYIKKLFSSNELYILFAVNYFRLKLFQHGLIDFSTIMEFARKDEMRFLYFNLEIEELYPEEYAKKLALDNWLKCKIYSYSGRHSFLKDRIRDKPIHSSENMSEDDIDETVIQPTIDIDPTKMSEMDEHTRKEHFRKMRDAGHNENLLAVFIRNDDVSALQQYLSRTNLPLGTCLPQSIFERCDFINEPTTELIDYAAFFGSISVFKFLILNTSDEDSYLREMWNQILAGEPIEDFVELQRRLSVAITRSLHLLTYAVAGGNYDIIHLCEEKKSLQLMIDNQSGLVSAYSKNETLNRLASQLNFRYNAIFNTAIRFHRNEIYDYLADNYYNNFLNDVLETNLGNMLIENFNTSIAFYNLDIFFRLLPIVTEKGFINSHDSDSETPLHVAAISGRFDIVKILCSIQGIDINSHAKHLETPLQWAISSGHIEIVKYLLGFEGIDHVAENDIGICNSFLF